MPKCGVCSNKADNKKYLIREMMFGTKEQFEYFMCSNCGCLQIAKIPEDLSKYYPKHRYKAYARPKKFKQNFFLYLAKKLVSWLYLKSKKNFLGEKLSNKLAYDFVNILSYANLKLTSQIFDVGAGSGNRLVSLAKKGFTNLSGSDIFIENDISYPNGIKILKKDISELDGKFDFIMLNHVFEHMPEPLLTLKILYKLLLPSHILLIRIPVVDSYAWEKYKENWVQLDAPRHLFLHTRNSINILAKESGFVLYHMIDDSKSSQFYGSEQYQNDIPMFAENSYYVNPQKSIFCKKNLTEFQKIAIKLNKKDNGDSVCFFLQKK